MDTAQYLKDLAAAEKKQKQTELDQARAQALTEVQRTEAQLMPQFTKQKQQASVQSQLGAKNFAEFLAQRGQTRAGLATQGELSRQNVLGRQIGEIGTAENQAVQQFGQQRADIGTQYQQNLTSAYGDIESSLRNSLFQLAQQREAEAKAQAEARRSSARSYASGGTTGFDFTDTPEQPAAQKGQLNGMPKSTQQYGVFSNGFQPRGITGHGKLSKTGDQVRVGKATQNIWKATDGSRWYWDGITKTYKVWRPIAFGKSTGGGIR